MMRKRIVVGNWKMHKSLSQAINHFNEIVEKLPEDKKIDIGIAAPSVFLSDLSMRRKKNILLFAQNCHWEAEGAYTGEISPAMLKSIHINGSLVAHSERRALFGETDVTAGKRVGALLKNGLRSILCVGESLEQRSRGLEKKVIEQQILNALSACGVKKTFEFIGSDPSSALFSIAYEPVWAIGTGRVASNEDIVEMHSFIRDVLGRALCQEMAESTRILYGGSVKPNNIKDLLSLPHVDGALVGGASLLPSDFLQLI